MCLTVFGITGLLVNPLFSIGIRKGNGYTQMGQPLWILVELIDVAWAWSTSFWIKNISTLPKIQCNHKLFQDLLQTVVQTKRQTIPKT